MKYILILSLAFGAITAKADIVKLVDGTSMGATFNSAPLNVAGYKAIGIHTIMSAAAAQAGSFKLQCSNVESPTADAQWVDIDSSAQTVSTTSTHYWSLIDSPCVNIRQVYTRTSGSATANTTINRVK